MSSIPLNSGLDLFLASSRARTHDATRPTRRQVAKSKSLDYKRIVAIALVATSHLLLFGTLMLPPKQLPFRISERTLDEPLVFETVKKPTQPKPEPKPQEIVRVIESKPAIAPRVERNSTPMIEQPAFENAEAAEEVGVLKPSLPAIEAPAAILAQASEALAVVKSSPPRYPPAQMNRGIEGTVRFKVFVDTDGRVQEIELLKSSGSSALDRAALTHIKRRWVFEPRVENGMKVASSGIGSVSFAMN